MGARVPHRRHHEVLPPILAGFLVREMALLDVTTGAYAQAPPGVRGLFVLGAPATGTARRRGGSLSRCSATTA
ncbi:hypothetical protein ACI2LO_33320 [Streptomyces sp. NPDC033754]|uniref:hypothetical protein n=1 Tax=unclassified Streptomyces TaxID=2593676 RepID=UPI0033CF1BA1